MLWAAARAALQGHGAGPQALEAQCTAVGLLAPAAPPTPQHPRSAALQLGAARKWCSCRWRGTRQTAPTTPGELCGMGTSLGRMRLERTRHLASHVQQLSVAQLPLLYQNNASVCVLTASMAAIPWWSSHSMLFQIGPCKVCVLVWLDQQKCLSKCGSSSSSCNIAQQRDAWHGCFQGLPGSCRRMCS